MREKINLTRNSFSKTQYPKVIDTEFSQLTPQITEPVATQDVSVDEFFVLYNKLFFDIPQRGNNSHETLIQTSTEYIGYEPLTTEIEALQQEITQLRRQLLEERSGALNTIADVLDSTGLNLPELPEIPELDIPSEFSVDLGTTNLNPEQEKTRKEKRKERREDRKKRRQERKDARRNN
jgi:hypothetical protein